MREGIGPKQERTDAAVGINRVADPHAPAPVNPAERAAVVRDVVRAVKALNAAEMFGPENELRFQRDPETRKMVMRLVNRETSEVVSQVPQECVLRLAAESEHR